MSDVHKIVEFVVLTKATQPRAGIVQVNTLNGVIKFEITEEWAHTICTELERFLTDATAVRVPSTSRP